MTKKNCYICQLEKMLDAFYPDHYSKDGRTSSCKKCSKKKSKEYYEKNKSKLTSEQIQKRRDSVKKFRELSKTMKEEKENVD